MIFEKNFCFNLTPTLSEFAILNDVFIITFIAEQKYHFRYFSRHNHFLIMNLFVI